MTVHSTPYLELLKGEGIPEFNTINGDAVNQAIPDLLKSLEAKLEALEAGLADPVQIGWDQLMKPLQDLGEHLRWSWGLVGHLLGVCNNPTLREAHQQQQAAVVRFSSRLAQSKPIYGALEALQRNSEQLSACQQRILKAELLAMRLRGVGLDAEDKETFNQLSEELSALATTFSNNILDATANWNLLVADPQQMHGCPHSLRQLLAEAAKNKDHPEANADDGPWLLGLDQPRYGPFMQFCETRELREVLYRAFITRAAQEPNNNQQLVVDILQLRQKKANLLGYKNWAEVSLASKMAPSVAAVENLLEDLREPSFKACQEEIEDLKTIQPELSEIQPWDVSFLAEKLRRKRFDIDSEALRPWFPLPQVLDGLFKLCERIFAIRVVAADGEASIWHSDVRYFKIFELHSNNFLASFFLDPYSRPGTKRGGAWMDECIGRHLNNKGDLVLPVAYLICNQSPPIGDTPSLMTIAEVETLFHEFGHGLQHMLTTVDQPEAAGINGVEWDAVELPSQFMENWCYEEKTLNSIARHWENGEPLPKSEQKKLLLARNYMAGANTLRQVHLALTDLRLHANWNDSGLSPEQLRRQIAKTTTVLPLLDEDCLLSSFSHIFAGGYSAGYYSYKWAEVLSADAFAAFEEVGLTDEKAIAATGLRFRSTVLSLGGSETPQNVFEAFRGRPPEAKALLRHSGLTS
jgi:oligopeptidase A